MPKRQRAELDEIKVIEDGWLYIPPRMFEQAAMQAVKSMSGIEPKDGWFIKAGNPRRTNVLFAELKADHLTLTHKTWPKGIKSSAMDSYIRLTVATMNDRRNVKFRFEVAHDFGGGSVNKETGWRELSFITDAPWQTVENPDPDKDDYPVNLLLEFRYNAKKRLVATVMVIPEANIGITMRKP